MASKRDIENQKELNALQRLTMSMAKDMEKSFDNIAEYSDKRNKSLQKDADITKKILNDLQKTGDVSKTLARIGTQMGQNSQKNYGVNQNLKIAYIAQLKAVRGIAEGQKEAARATQGVFDVTDEVGKSFNNVLNNIDGFINRIPIIGPALSNAFNPLKEKGEKAIQRATDGMKNGFIRQFTIAKKEGLSFAQSFSKGMSGGLKGAQGAIAGTLGISTALVGTLLVAVGVVYLLAKAFQIGLNRFKEIDAAAASFRKNTGLLTTQTRQLSSNIQQVSSSMASLGVSAEDVATAASDFTNEFGGLEQPSKQVLESMVALNKNFGIGTQEAAKLNKVFQNIGGLTAAQSQALIGQTAQMAEMAGVAPSKVIQDMAQNSEFAYQFFGGSAEELAKSAVSAAALGTSIAEAGKVARGLLDYQSSISSELEAGAILGTNINLSQARYLAANGKVLESQQAVLNSVSQLGDLTKLNVYEQEALVEATGMEFSSLVNQQRIRERFGNLKEKELAAAQSLIDAGRDINKLTRDDLAAQTKRISNQKRMQSVTDNISNQTSALKTAFADMFQPLADFAMPILSDILDVLVMQLGPAFTFIGSVLSFLLKPLGFIIKLAFAILKPIAQIGGMIFTALAEPLNYVASIFDDMESFIDNLGRVINEYLVEPIAKFYSTVSNGLSSITFGLFGDSADTQGISGSTVTSVNDAVISPQGDIISTSPQDYLIATKTPSDLVQTPSPLSKVSTNLMNISQTIPMDGIIAELKDLKSAFLSNKDVYLGREKVTAAVTVTQERSSKNSFGMSLA